MFRRALTSHDSLYKSSIRCLHSRWVNLVLLAWHAGWCFSAHTVLWAQYAVYSYSVYVRRCTAADRQQAVIWTCGLPLASEDQISTVRDHSSHCVYLRDSLLFSLPSLPLSLCLPQESLQAGPLPLPSPPHSLTSSSMLTSPVCLTFLTCLCLGSISKICLIQITFQDVIHLTLKNYIIYLLLILHWLSHLHRCTFMT